MSPEDVAARVAARLAAVRERIEAAATRAGRTTGEITLVGVAKRQPAEAVVAAVAAGLSDVAESFAQEARQKIPVVNAALKDRGMAPPRWHFVGQLQRNKARLVAPLCHQVQSLDRASLAEELDRRASAAGRQLDVLLQVNLSDEPQKGGADPAELPALLKRLSGCSSLHARGLMTIPRAQQDPELTRETFARLRALRDHLCQRPEGHTLPELSMGMTADFEVAIEEGATLVRVGTALFGPRPAP